MSKKLISVMLALVMVLSVFSVSAFAAVNVQYETFDEETEDAIAYTQYWSLETDNVANASGEYTVNVCLETNYVVGAMSFVIEATGATIKAATEGDAITEGYNADVQISDDGNKVFIIPDPSYEGENGLTLEAGSVIATLTYTLDEGVQTATLDLINDAKTVDNSGDLVAVRLDDETLSTETMFYGQRVIDAEGNDIEIGEVIASVTLGEEAAADPVLKGIDTGVVDTTNGYVYGVPAGDDVANYFEVENGTFEMVANDSGYTNGTGATLVVKNNADEEFATYTLIIFGDVNGDAAVTAADYTVVKNASLGGVIPGDANAFAADVNGADGATAADYTVVKTASLGGDITVNPYAA